MRWSRLSPPLLHFFTAALVCVVVGAWPSASLAKSKRQYDFSYERMWPTVVRFLRVDAGLKLTEKDADTGYVLFELKDEGKVFTGSAEVIRGEDKRRPSVEVILHIEGRPSYMEIALLDKLQVKIRKELGSPKDPEPEPEPPPKKGAEDKDEKSDD